MDISDKTSTINAMLDGNKELNLWLKDALHQGLVNLRAQPDNYWDDFAAYMVDCKLSGISKRIKKIKQLLLSEADLSPVFEELAFLIFFSQRLTKIDRISEPELYDLLQFGGMTIRKKDLLEKQGNKDHWMVVGLTNGLEENLNFRRTWIFSEKQRSFALILDFSWGGQPFEQHYELGEKFNGEIVYYPGQHPFRAVVKDKTPSINPFLMNGGVQDFKILRNEFANFLSKNPLQKSFPCFLVGVKTLIIGEDVLLTDPSGSCIQINNYSDPWKIVGQYCLNPLSLIGEWDGKTFRILSLIHEHFIKPI